MLSCWSTRWQPPQKNSSLLSHDTCWLKPKLVPSSRTEFLARLGTCSCLLAPALCRDGTKLSDRSRTSMKWRSQGHGIAGTLNSGRRRDGWKQLLKEIKIYFLHWNIQNKINWLNFTSSHEKIHLWNASSAFRAFCTQAQFFFPVSFLSREAVVALPSMFWKAEKSGLGQMQFCCPAC